MAHGFDEVIGDFNFSFIVTPGTVLIAPDPLLTANTNLAPESGHRGLLCRLKNSKAVLMLKMTPRSQQRLDVRDEQTGQLRQVRE